MAVEDMLGNLPGDKADIYRQIGERDSSLKVFKILYTSES